MNYDDFVTLQKIDSLSQKYKIFTFACSLKTFEHFSHLNSLLCLLTWLLSAVCVQNPFEQPSTEQLNFVTDLRRVFLSLLFSLFVSFNLTGGFSRVNEFIFHKKIAKIYKN